MTRVRKGWSWRRFPTDLMNHEYSQWFEAADITLFTLVSTAVFNVFQRRHNLTTLQMIDIHFIKRSDHSVWPMSFSGYVQIGVIQKVNLSPHHWRI